MFIIPFKEPSYWREQITLSGVVFVFAFKWNALNEFWVMDIYDSEEQPLILGIKIVPNYPLLDQYSVDGMPSGEIICQNIVAAPDTISRFDMSQKFELVYYEAGEIQGIIARQAELNAQ